MVGMCEETTGYCQITQSPPSVVSRGLSGARGFLYSGHVVGSSGYPPLPQGYLGACEVTWGI